MQSVATEDLWESYKRHLSVHRVAKEFGFGSGIVFRRLKKAGYVLKKAEFTPAEDEQIKSYYETTKPQDFRLDVLKNDLGRSGGTNVCRRALQLGLQTQKNRAASNRTKHLISVAKKDYYSTHEHPKGPIGMKHTEATRKRMSVAHVTHHASRTPEQKAATTLKVVKTKEARGNLYAVTQHRAWKSGWHEIGGKRHYFRSSWEVNYAHYLEWLRLRGEIKEWEFEPKTFWFEAIMRGTRSYLPDFRVTENTGKQVYHEIKGWMDPKSVTKLKRMKKYYPEVELLLIDAKQYRVLDKQLKGLVPGWGSSGCVN